MSNFTIGEAWSQGVAFLTRNFTILLILIGGSVLIGSAIQIFAFGINLDLLSQQMATSMQGGNPQDFIQTMLPGLLVGGLIGAIIQSTGTFAAYRAGLSDEQDITSLLTYGLSAAVLSLLFWGVIFIALAIVFGLLVVALGAGAMFTGGSAGGSSGAMAAAGVIMLMALLLLPLMLWLTMRLWVMGPAMADARSANPLFGLSQSWRLTGPNQWPMLGYLMLLIIAGLVIFSILGLIGGVIGSLLGGNGGAFLSAVLTGVPVGILGVAITAGVYRTLVPVGQADIFN